MATRLNQTTINISKQIKEALAEHKDSNESWDDLMIEALAQAEYIVENASDEEKERIIKEYGKDFNLSNDEQNNSGSNNNSSS